MAISKTGKVIKPKPKEEVATPKLQNGDANPIPSLPLSKGADGSYDATKGGFTTSPTTANTQGKFYPTGNPNFRPGALGKPGSSIEFTKDGNVIEDGITMSAQDYQNKIKQDKINQPYNEALANQENLQNQLGQIGNLTPEQQALANSAQETQPLDFGQASKAGLGAVSSAVPTIAGATALATVGTTPVGGAITAGIGAIGTFIAGARADLKSQRASQYSVSSGSLSDHKANMNKFIVARDVSAYNEQLAYIIRDYGQLNLNAKANVNDFLGKDGLTQLSDYENFINGGGIDALNTKLALAVANPKANAVDLFTAEELGFNAQ